MDPMTAELLRQGLLGLVVCAESLVIVKLWSQLQKEHEARLQEMRETTKQLLDVTEKTNQAIERLHELAEHLTQQKNQFLTTGKRIPV